jgi:uroporphyrinogen III methyltransferase/synthase
MNGMSKGKVFFVGAGPGDPKLITLRGKEAISCSDVVVYDRLASPRLLRWMKAGAQKIYVGKLPDRHTLKQEEINALLLELALAGKVVTRLKGGDPAVFGRVGEEALTLAEQGVPFEMVPGVTSAIAVPAYAGIPVTHRGLTSSFAVVTGHECPKKDDSDLYWQKLSTATGTIIFLMGVKNLSYICEQMIACGRDKDTPVAVIQWGTCSEQRTVTGTLETIVTKVNEARITSPAITIVGEVVKLREKLQWFEQKPLFGQKIVVTRARSQASELVAQIEELGGEAIEFPVIETRAVTEQEERTKLRMVMDSLPAYDWLLFTSTNGVRYFFEELRQHSVDIRSVSAHVAAVGTKTAALLEEYGLRVHSMPERYNAAELAHVVRQTVGQHEDAKKVLLARAKTATPELPRLLTEARLEVDDVAFYETAVSPVQDEYALEQLLSGHVNTITFTSSSTVTNFLHLMTPHGFVPSTSTKVVCIGPVTAQTAREAGLLVTHVAEQATIESLLRVLTSQPEEHHSFIQE